jgi:hypothetical protein
VGDKVAHGGAHVSGLESFKQNGNEVDVSDRARNLGPVTF